MCLGIPGKRVFSNKTLDIWVRKLEPMNNEKVKNVLHNSFAIGVLNRKKVHDLLVRVNILDLGLNFEHGYRLKDLFRHKELGILKPVDKLKVIVPPTGIRLIRADPILIHFES